MMDDQQETHAVSRRTLVTAAVAGAGAIALASPKAFAQSGPAAPPSTVTTPPRDFSRHGAPIKASMTVEEDPTMEVVTLESTGGTLTPDQKTMRDGWLGSRRK